ncbi:hypothetical protein M1O52_01465 [Dehalococcoidia bacterium]|nr:hypothetical protein [Dehalococcoidia bacterium]
MDKAIITVLLIIAGVACVAFIFNSVYPAITRGSDAVVSMADRIDDRIRSQVNIIHAVSEYDPNAPGNWTDINTNTDFDIFAWVKNVGTTRILTPRRSDVFFGREGSFQRIPHDDFVDPGVWPYWQYVVEDTGGEWVSARTLKITIVYSDDWATSGLSPGVAYLVKMILPNGISDEIYFSF